MGVAAPLRSPWTYEASDYVGLRIGISVTFDEADEARPLTGASLWRESGCQFHAIVIDSPDSPKVKRITGPADGQNPLSVSGAQLRSRGLSTIDDVIALQITALP